MSIVVENAGNTCYIDSLIISLFYPDESLDYLLDNHSKNHLIIYLQEYIKHNVIQNIRAGISVTIDIMHELRTLCIMNGWKSKEEKEHYQQQDVNEFYTFLLEIFEGPLLELQRQSITEALNHDDDKGRIEKIPFVPLCIPETYNEKEMIKISGSTGLLHKWLFENQSLVNRYVITNKGKEEKLVDMLNTYHIINCPNILALGINRFKNQDKKDNVGIDIPNKLTLNINNSMFGKRVWCFRSAICHTGQTAKAGHYYSLIKKNNDYYIFDDLKQPAFRSVNMENPTVVTDISKECVFIIYTSTNG